MKPFDLTGKVVILGASSGGMGRGIAKVFAESGAQIIITGRNVEKIKSVSDSICSNGGLSDYHQLDLYEESSVIALMDDVYDKYGHLDGLVNIGADTKTADGKIADMPVDVWDKMFAANLRGTFMMCKYAIPKMQATGGGSIVNIGSMSGVLAEKWYGAYGPSKAGVAHLSKYIAWQYGHDNIRCNCVHPGFTIHDGNRDAVPETLKEILEKEIMVNRCGKAEDIGYMALFLISDESGYVTSQVICVDGGMTNHMPYDTAKEKWIAEMSK